MLHLGEHPLATDSQPNQGRSPTRRWHQLRTGTRDRIEVSPVTDFVSQFSHDVRVLKR